MFSSSETSDHYKQLRTRTSILSANDIVMKPGTYLITFTSVLSIFKKLN